MAYIDDLAGEYYTAWLDAAPTEAHMIGEYAWANRYETYSRDEEDAQIAELRGFAAAANAIADTDLDDQQRVTRDVLVSDATARAAVLESRLRTFSADPLFGPQATLPLVVAMLNIPDADVADAMVEKFHAIGRAYVELADRQREGRGADRFSPEFAVTGTIGQLEEILATPVDRDPLLAKLTPPGGIDADRWRARMVDAVDQSIRPGMAAYLEALREALPHARPDDRAGLCWLDGGDAAYASTLRFFTTTGMTAEEIHAIGLQQVEQLADEYRGLGPEVVGTDDLGQIFEAMRTDPKLHFENAEQLVDGSKVALQRAWDAMPAWFEVLPKAPCAVEATTVGAKAFYYPPAIDGSRGGTFFVNVLHPEAWGTFELEAMAFHEGIPGHHLQIAIASELDDLPEFRKHLHNAGYAEGWGLYTERLADEMGLYSSDLDRLGKVSYDAWRASRLVVDTGIHAKGWTRAQAEAFMREHTALTPINISNEVDRYIGWPGQALAYKVGQLEILRLRREAEGQLGTRFDLPAFHAIVLGAGAVTLPVLADRVTAWIETVLS